MLCLSPWAAPLWGLLVVVQTHVADAAGGHTVDIWNLEKEWGLDEENEDPYEAPEERVQENKWEKNLEKAGKRQKKAKKQAIKEGREPDEDAIDFSDPAVKEQIRTMMMQQGGGGGGFGGFGGSFGGGGGAGAFGGLQQAVGAAPNKLDEGKSIVTLKKGFCNWKGCVREKLQNWGGLMVTGGVKSQYMITAPTSALYVKSNDMKKLGEFLLQQPEVVKWTFKKKDHFPSGEVRDTLREEGPEDPNDEL